MTNLELALGTVSGLLQQALAYQMAIQKANAEGRDITEAELDAVRGQAVEAIDKLAGA